MVFAAIGTSANGDAYDSASVRVASKRLRQRPDHLGHCVEVQGWLTQLGTGQPVAMEVTTFSFDVSEGWKNIQAGRVADVLCQMMSPSGFGHIIVRDGSNTATVEVSYTRVDRVLRASGCTWTRSIAPPSSCTCLWARNLETLPMVLYLSDARVVVAADSCNKIALKHRAGSIAFMHVEAMDSRAKAAFEAAVVVVFVSWLEASRRERALPVTPDVQMRRLIGFDVAEMSQIELDARRLLDEARRGCDGHDPAEERLIYSVSTGVSGPHGDAITPRAKAAKAQPIVLGGTCKTSSRMDRMTWSLRPQGPVQFKDDLGHGALVAFFYEVAFLPLRKTLDDELILLDVSVGAQRLKEYNLWVCPHCEQGVKVADVTDLSCEVSSSPAPSGHEWSWVKKAMRNFLRSLNQPPEKRTHQHEVDELIKLASAPLQGECYLGIVALGFFVFHFMDPAERQGLIRTSVFGGVTFQKAVPLSYWDVYASGWPIFGLMATATEAVQNDIQTSSAPATQPDVGMTGIDLGKRECCDFPSGSATAEDRRFLVALSQSLQGTAWLASEPTSPALPLRTSLEYLSQTAYRRCSWGRATAYFAAAESLLVTSSLSQSVWNSTKALVALGEHNLDGCEPNMTVYHQMQSVWPFWQILGRLEARSLPLEAPGSVGPSTSSLPPPALPEAVRLKWQRLLESRGLQVEEEPSPNPPVSVACLGDTPGFAHVALSADLAQIDGLIVTLQSAISSAANASRLCFHAFVLPHQRDVVIEGLRCAFADAFRAEDASLSGPVLGAFRLHGQAQLLVHGLDPDHIWAEVGMNATGTLNHPATAVMMGETDLSNSLRSDTGNLGAVHNFARFSLHTLLPALSRVVYMDVDVVVRGDLAELYNVPMRTVNGAPGTVAAVQRSNQPLRTYVDVLQPAVPSWLPSEAPSFNAGVMVIDLVRWRQRQASRLIAEWIQMNSRRRLWLHGSQPPLLLLFHDEVVSLHWSWNVDGLGHRLNYPKHVLAEAKVLHWTGPLKPWRHHGVNRKLWEPHTREYCPKYSFREHTTTCRPDSWFC
ncbi:GAUT15 [Symbiodinium natans]|uniref:GAUT15 protein n=1 Tax=Symbiodinium natans TaxID=878477 RepID=A0A812TKB7_9DINO|nr:GAUT15 [Symbiodinium natans]